ncbi:MAG: hypothetical protein R6V83_09360 [Candidatus Thorarchaeota archaeon]
MTDVTTPFEKMVRLLMDKYGMNRPGAEKLVARSSEAILTVREQTQFEDTFKEFSEQIESNEARIEALKHIVNSNGAWHALADEAHRYQLSHRFVM